VEHTEIHEIPLPLDRSDQQENAEWPLELKAIFRLKLEIARLPVMMLVLAFVAVGNESSAGAGFAVVACARPCVTT
jgi:hypothetical protein